MDLARTRVAQELDDARRRRPADDRIVDDDDPQPAGAADSCELDVVEVETQRGDERRAVGARRRDRIDGRADPRTIESSTTTTRSPRRFSMTGLNFKSTPRARIT